MAYILAADLGSTQLKLMLMDETGAEVLTVSEKYPTRTACGHKVEQDTNDWERALRSGILRLKEREDLKKVEIISFSGHMSGVVLLGCDGTALHPCIMLSDSRSQKQSEALLEEMGETVKYKTGNPINNAFSLPKLRWLSEERPELFQKAKAWLSPKDFLRYRLTGKCVTDYTDAYNALCIDPGTMDWDQEAVKACGLRESLFPPVCSPFDIVGKVTAEGAARFGLPEGLPVACGGADMACAALGMGLSEPGDGALTLGTCATFLSMVPKADTRYYGQVTFHPHVTKGKMYALGSHFNGGAAVNWLLARLSEKEEADYGLIRELAEAASDVPPGSHGLVTIPFLAGSGSPRFCGGDRQHMIGMRISTTRGEIFRSQLEGVTYNLRQSFLIFQEMARLTTLTLAGGGIHIDLWTDMIADIFGIPAAIAGNPDVSTAGAAIIGGTAAGMFEDAGETARKRMRILEVKYPNPEHQELYQAAYERFLNYNEMMHRLDLEY